MKNTTFKYSVLASAVFLSLTACNDTTNNENNNNVNKGEDDTLHSIFLSKVGTAKVITECGARNGVEIESGFDLNKNNKLDDDEVDNSYIVCNGENSTGSDAITISQASASSEQCANGGTLLTVGAEIIPLCHASSGGNSSDFNKVKEMMTGFKNWAHNIETLSERVADDAKMSEQALITQSKDLEDILIALAVLAEAAYNVDEENDGEYGIAALVDIPDAVSQVSGIITRTGQELTLSNAVFELETGAKVSIKLASIVLPVNSGTEFNLEINELEASSDNATFKKVSASIKYTPKTTFDRTTGNLSATEASIQIELGSESAQVSIYSNLADPIRFEGFMNFDVVVYPFSDDLDLNVKQAYAEGTMTHAGKTLELKTSYTMSNADAYRIKVPQDYTDVLASINDGTLGGSLAATVDVSDKYADTTLDDVVYEHNNGGNNFDTTTLDSIIVTRYIYKDIHGNEYTADFGRFEIENTDGVTVTFYNYIRYDGSESFSANYGDSSYLDVMNNFYRNKFYLYPQTDSSSDDITFNEYIGGDNYWIHIKLIIGNELTLPSLGETLSFSSEVIYTDLDVNDIRENAPRFGFTPLYEFSANIKASGFSDTDGNELEDVTLMIGADRTGYSSELGSIDVGLTIGGTTFSGHFPNQSRDTAALFDDDYLDLDHLDDINLEKSKFSFTDNQGGLIRFDRVVLSYDSYSWDDSYYDGSFENSSIYYNGHKYGEIYIDSHDDIIIYYTFDGSEEIFRPETGFGAP